MPFGPALHGRPAHMAKPPWLGARRLTLADTLALERSGAEASTGSPTCEFLRATLLLKQQDVVEAAAEREPEAEPRAAS